jgi:hypothetical protein
MRIRMDQMKVQPDYEDESYDVTRHMDESTNVITAVAQFPTEVIMPIIDKFTQLVRTGHEIEKRDPTPAGMLKRAQEFEEGDVYMLEAPYEGYFADRYVMDFYDVEERDICSRMHIHTGLRFVRIMTGIDTTVRISSLTPFSILKSPVWGDTEITEFIDDLPDVPDGRQVNRYNAVVPPNSWVDMQVPRGQSHQFNAVGPNAVIDSVHPEESIEVLRENMSGYKMMAQTIFLAEVRPHADTCNRIEP